MQAAQVGRYDVVASNPAGVATSGAAALCVKLPDVGFLSAAVLTNAQVQLFFVGVPGQVCVIQASTNLVQWQPISVLTASTGSLTFVDPATSNFPCRFYAACQSSTQAVTDFETWAPGCQVMFQPTSSSGSTAGFRLQRVPR